MYQMDIERGKGMNAVQKFENKHMMAFIELQQITKQQKELKARDAEIRAILSKGMEEYGIESIDNEFVKINYIQPTAGSLKLDEKSWKAEDPDGYRKVFQKYNKMQGAKKGHVRIDPK